MPRTRAVGFDVIVIGGGHAGAEAAWAAANLDARVALVTMDPSKIGAMSCNPAIGGLAKGQMVREIDALGGLMGLAIDATGIQFRMLNASKGPAVWGPRAQADKYRYAAEVHRLLRTREQITVLAGRVERVVVEGGRVRGIDYTGTAVDASHAFPGGPPTASADCCGDFGDIGSHEKGSAQAAPGETARLEAGAVVLTTGTFMRGLMHTGDSRTEGGRVGEAPVVGISAALREMGFELGRLKTGTPPRLDAGSIDFDGLEVQPGDEAPTPFSYLTGRLEGATACDPRYHRVARRFPVLEQRPCWVTHTNAAIHERIRDNLDRAPMYNGQIESTTGPRYCPSIEDKVVRFADKQAHHVFLEPESLCTTEIYCNGISTSLPTDVQDFVVAQLPGCERAKVLRYGYAVEYDMVWPHQIDATCMSKPVTGLFLAGQINGTSGYEEAGGQGLMAGLNAVRFVRGEDLVHLRRDQAYIGVLMDDLITKRPREPYRMFTSRAEFRLLLRADNADARLTELGRAWGLVDNTRWAAYERREAAMAALRDYLSRESYDGQRLIDYLRRPEADMRWLHETLAERGVEPATLEPSAVATVLADVQYAGYIERQQRDIDRLAQQEATPLPTDLDYATVKGLRSEAAHTLNHFRPATLGQASRLAGVNPADLMLVSVALRRRDAVDAAQGVQSASTRS